MYVSSASVFNYNYIECFKVYLVSNGKWIQIYLSFVVTLLNLSESLNAGWTSNIIDSMVDDESSNSTQSMSLKEASLIGTLPVYASIVPIPFLMYCAERIGRKWTIIYGSFFIFTNWILLYIAKPTDLILIYIGVSLRGIGALVLYSITPIYITEIAQANIRGILGTFLPILMNLGYLLSYIFLTFITPQQLSLIGALVTVVFLILFIRAPKTPYFLTMKKQTAKAQKSLQLLRGKDNNIKLELNDIQESIEKDYLNSASCYELMNDPKNYKSLFIVFLLVLFQQLTGIDSVLLFLRVILRSSNVYFTKNVSSIMFISAKLLSCICALVLMDKLGRRVLLLFSAISTSVTLAALGLYFYYKDILNEDTSSISSLPLLLLILYILSYSIGFGSVNFVLTAEILPTRLRAFGAQVSQIFYAISFALTTEIFVWLKDSYGFYSAFWFLSASTFIGLIFIGYFVFETKGKSLKQIQDEF